MLDEKSKLVGILGGMGPEATAAFFAKMIRNTPAQKDQDHLQILIFNNPRIPDRTAAIFGRGVSPVRALIRSARLLANAGVDLMVIPCVTSHAFYNEVQGAVSVPILNIVEETIAHVNAMVPRKTRIGILATSGTIKCALFQRACEKHGLEVLVPPAGDQDVLMDAIYGKDGIKAAGATNSAKEKILHVADALIRRSADVIIGGCTEIPLAVNSGSLPVPFVDTLEVLAVAAVRKATANVPEETRGTRDAARQADSSLSIVQRIPDLMRKRAAGC